MKIPFMKIHFVYLFDFLFFNSLFHTVNVTEHLDGIAKNVNRGFSVIYDLDGHFPDLRLQVTKLTEDMLVRILKEPKNALTKQYEALLAMDNVALEITPDALEAVAEKAIEREIGARGLRSIMESIMMKIMYQIPSDLTIKKVTITPECVLGGEPVILRDSKNPRVPTGAKK